MVKYSVSWLIFILQKLVQRQKNRLRIEQWKKEIDIKKRNQNEGSTLVRPKSVDSGMHSGCYYIYHLIMLFIILALLRSRQARDFETAKERLNKTAAKQESLMAREFILKKTESMHQQWEGPSKLLSSTKAAAAQRVTPEELDDRENRRLHGSAHSSRVASGGYDLKYSGRAKPSWTKGVCF